jgi:hypothetical protein
MTWLRMGGLKMTDPFAQFPVVGRLAPDALSQKLDEVEEDVTAVRDATAKGGVRDFFMDRDKYLYLSQAHAVGFVRPLAASDERVDIIDASQAPLSPELKNTRLSVTLNALRVAHYPGGGIHRVLFDFFASNQLPSGAEELHFNSTYRITEAQRAGIRGYPIFVGLTVGSEGLGIRCYTVNVKNDDDEAFLDALDSDVFKTGLKLATVAQPALAPLTGLAVGLTKAIAGRRRNVPVQDVYLGLDFARTPGGARLALGAYVVVQIPERDREVWSWNEWNFKGSTGQVVGKADPVALIPYNYFIFGVSQFSG